MAWWIFQNVVTIALLAAAVAIVCRFSRIGPVARHALWVLVLVKFITPPVVVWPWAAPDPLGLASLTSEAPGPPAAGAVDAIVTSPLMMSASSLADVESTEAAAAKPEATRAAISPWTVLPVIWIAGSLCLLGIEIARLTRLARRVRRAPPADPAIVCRVSELADQLGVAPMPVLALTGSASPVVWCFGRPRLLWPAWLTSSRDSRADSADSRTDSELWTPDPGLTKSCIDGLIVHELAHIKRRDHFVGWIELVAGVVWWWNPLFWSVRSALREQAELACDAWVIAALPDGRRAYAESLLALSSPGAPAVPSMAAVVGVRASSRRVLERRLVMIMKGRASLRLPWAGLLTLALLAVATLPAWATGTNATDPQAVQAVQAAQATPTPTSTPAPPKVVQRHLEVKPMPVTVHTVKPTVVTHDGKQVHAIGTLAVKPTVHVQQKAVTVRPVLRQNLFSFLPESSRLPEEGKKLVTDYSTDVEAIYKEVDTKIAARRDAAVKALEALQEQYTKAGKLDEALAIRDYLRSGGPGSVTHSLFMRKGVR